MKFDFEMVVTATEAAVKAFKGSRNDRICVVPQVFRGQKVTKILKGAFQNCSSLRYIFIPRTVHTIEENAFSGCRELHLISSCLDDYYYWDLEKADMEALEKPLVKAYRCVLPGVTEIGKHAFKGTVELQCVELTNKGPLRIGDGAFEGSGIESLYSFSRDTRFGPGAFQRCTRLVGVYLPVARVESLPSELFLNCTHLSGFVCKQLVGGIGQSCFRGCKALKDIEGIPPTGVKEIGEGAFEDSGIDPTKLKSSPPKETPTTTKQNKNKRKKEVEEKEMAVFRFPLFQATNATNAKVRLHEGKILSGRFRTKNDGGGVVFLDEDNRRELFTCDGPTLPLLKWLGRAEQDVTLCMGENGACTGILLPPGNKQMSAKLLKSLCYRLCGEREKDRELIYSADELNLMSQILWDTFPKAIQNAISRDQALLKSGESSQRNHALKSLRHLINVDWTERPRTNLPTVEEARKALDAAFYGMESVKKALQTELANMRRTGRPSRGGILLLGEPGSGKTCIVRKFCDICGLGIIPLDMTTQGKDIEGVTGSGRFFDNGLPGSLAGGFLKIGSPSDAAVFANELDQANAQSDRGAIAEVLRGIVDRQGIYENHLEVDLPVENVIVLATANTLATISKPLQDRFVIIEVPPYSRQEKREILKNYALPKSLEMKKLPPEQVVIQDEAIDLLINDYLHEPGIRDVEQALEKLLGEVVLASDGGSHKKYVYGVDEIRKLFGPPQKLDQHFVACPGQVEYLFANEQARVKQGIMEATARAGNGNITVLGLGEKQANFVKAAYQSIRNLTPKLSQVDITVFTTGDVPDTPQNQVGLAAYLAICSCLAEATMPLSETACFGGVDLHGNVYHSGVKPEMLLRAAARSGRSVVLAPCGTREHLEEGTQVNLIEGMNARILFEMAVAQAQNGTPS